MYPLKSLLNYLYIQFQIKAFLAAVFFSLKREIPPRGITFACCIFKGAVFFLSSCFYYKLITILTGTYMYVVIKQFSTPKNSLKTEQNFTLIDDEDGIKRFPPPKLLSLFTCCKYYTQ